MDEIAHATRTLSVVEFGLESKGENNEIFSVYLITMKFTFLILIKLDSMYIIK